MREFHKDNVIPSGDCVWVFGSNEKGAHGKGAAKVAKVNFHAEYGVGHGPTGRAYAIPTRDKHLALLTLPTIGESITGFLLYASEHPATAFFVTRIGVDVTGYSDLEIGPRFVKAPSNCVLPEEWKPFCNSHQSQEQIPRRNHPLESRS